MKIIIIWIFQNQKTDFKIATKTEQNFSFEASIFCDVAGFMCTESQNIASYSYQKLVFSKEDITKEHVKHYS